MSSFRISCECKLNSFEVTRAPRFRVICHCTICQNFNLAPYGDTALYSTSMIQLPQLDKIEFRSYKSVLSISRGKCMNCKSPFVEIFESLLMPSLIMIPCSAVDDKSTLPKPIAHIFYDCRCAEVADDLPKYSGYLASQLAFGSFLLTHRGT